MNIEIGSVKLTFSLIDKETGEIFTKEATLGDFTDVKKKSSSSSKTKKPKDDNPNPTITLLENKLQFNAAAVELTGYIPDEKYEVKFEKKGRKVTPIIQPEPNKGNRLTKTYTISFRGSRHDNLIEYGDEFILEPYPDHEGWFKLIGNKEKEDDIIDIPDEVSSPEEDFGIDSSSDDNEVDFNLDF